MYTVIVLPVHSDSFAHNFVSGMQSFYFSESQYAIVVFWTHKFAVELIGIGYSESQDP